MKTEKSTLNSDFKVAQSSSFVSVATSDDDTFMGLAHKIRSNFSRSIGQKNKIIAFYSPNELVQRKYLFKLISKINLRFNNENIDFCPDNTTDIKLMFKKANSLQMLVNLPIKFDKNAIIFDTKHCDEMLKKYLIKMIGAKHDEIAYLLRFVLNNKNELERLSDLLNYKEHLRYTIDFCYDKALFENFCALVAKIDSKGFKLRFSALGSLLEEHFITLECSLGDDFSKVRASYLRLSKQYHPDYANKNIYDITELRNKFQEISFAYEALKPFFAEQDKYLKGIA